MFPEVLTLMVEDLFKSCTEKGLTLSVAESCTGGLFAGCITSVPGSSAVFERGFVTYTNKAKGQMLGVPAYAFIDHGDVSEECALAMVHGALNHSHANLSVSITGIAGPGGATETKPVGRVHIACAREGFDTLHEQHTFKGDREGVRMQAIESALRLLNQMAGK